MSYRILSLNGAVGYSFPEESLEEAMKTRLDIIADDGGTMDGGPYYLGEGVTGFKRPSLKRDLSLMIRAAFRQGCPLVIGTCIMSGDTPHMQLAVDLVKEIFEEQGVENVKVAVIESHIDPALIIDRLDEMAPLGHMPPLTREAVEKSRIVAAMGIAPFITALNEGARVVLAGRACDVSIFAADPVRRGLDPGLAFQAGHVLECGALACDPGSASDCLIAEFTDDGAVIFTPPNKARKATSYSVAAHSLYEENHPALQSYPEGVLVMEDTKYFDVPPRSAGIRNAGFVSGPLSVKIEGSMCIGSRVASFLSLKGTAALDEDPFLSRHLIYGVNAVERNRILPGEEELGILLTVKGKDEETVAALASTLKGYLLHFGYPGRLTTAGNIAFPLSPIELIRKEDDGHFTGLVIGGTREPLFISEKDALFASVLELGRQQYPELMKACEVAFLTSDREHPMMFLDTIGETREEAEKLHGEALARVKNYIDPGRPSYLAVHGGNAYIWSIYHIWNNGDAIKEHLFPIRLFNARGREWEFLKEVRPVYEETGDRNYAGSLDEKELDVIHEVDHAGKMPTGEIPLVDMVKVLRSKDAGVNTITYDIFFKDERSYRQALASNVFTKRSVAKILNIPEAHIIGTYRADPCHAIKISRFREMISGTPGSPDGFGAQQHMRIERITIPVYDG
ncbi:MAG TPA: DUF4387 family protein [Syntrophorhabdaceae bacterium]|nr:DUF4387 family protein [Syntrophorhabdaceae bacterium]